MEVGELRRVRVGGCWVKAKSQAFHHWVWRPRSTRVKVGEGGWGYGGCCDVDGCKEMDVRRRVTCIPIG